jgi:hypothetical protein
MAWLKPRFDLLHSVRVGDRSPITQARIDGDTALRSGWQ